MGTVVGTCMPETEHHQTTTQLTTNLAPIRRRRYGNVISNYRSFAGIPSLHLTAFIFTFFLKLVIVSTIGRN